MQFLDQFVAHFLVRDVELDANHQAHTSNLNDVRKILALESVDKVLAHLGSILHKVLAFHNIEHGKS